MTPHVTTLQEVRMDTKPSLNILALALALARMAWAGCTGQGIELSRANSLLLGLQA